MRFNELLHPEVVCDKRGEKLEREVYKDWHSLVDSDYKKFLPKNATTQRLTHYLSMLMQDQIFTWHVVLSKIFKLNHGKIYRFSKGITEDLSKISKELPLHVLPKKFIGYFSFPPDLIYDEESPIQGAYVHLCQAKDVHITAGRLPVEDDDLVLWLSYVNQPKQKGKQMTAAVGGMLYPLTSAKIENLDHIDDANFDYSINLLGMKEKSDPGVIKKRNIVFQTVINCLIFLHSTGMNLQTFSPNSNLSNKEILRRNGVINEISMPVTFVQRNYHGTIYTVDKVSVRGHPRWQRKGKGLLEVELIWISPYAKNLKKALTTTVEA